MALGLGLRAVWPTAQAPVEDPTASVDVLRPTTPGIAEARRLLDGYGGDRSVLLAAQALLEPELARNPRDPEALMQWARVLNWGAPDGGEQAIEVLDTVHRIAPDFAEAYVLRVSILTELDRIDEANRAVGEAVKRRSTSAWLDVNRGMLLVREGRYRVAAELCGKVIERFRETPRTHLREVVAAYQCRRPWLRRSGRLDLLDGEYRAALEVAPDWAWLLEAYAEFLCQQQGRCAEALPIADRALASMDYPRARQTRAAIRYDLWAKHSAAGTGESVEARQLLAAARRDLPDASAVMARYGGKVDNAALVAALVAQGVSPNVVVGNRTALQSAACCGNAESVQVLIAAGADVNAVTPGGWSALMVAARENNVAVAQALIDAGADARSRPAAAWHITTEHDSVEVRKLLVARFPDDI